MFEPPQVPAVEMSARHPTGCREEICTQPWTQHSDSYKALSRCPTEVSGTIGDAAAVGGRWACEARGSALVAGAQTSTHAQAHRAPVPRKVARNGV